MTELFRDGDWRLMGWSQGDFSHKDYSEIQHHCSQPYGGVRGELWWYYAYNGCCGICNADIPDEMIGLKNLHNWDR